MRCLNCHRQIEEGSICPDCRTRQAQPSDEQPNGLSNGFMWFLLLTVVATAFLVIAKYQGQPELWMWTALIGVTLLLILLECIRRFIAHQKKLASEPPPTRTWQSPIYPYQTYELAEPRLSDSGKYQCPECRKHFDQWESAKPTHAVSWWKFKLPEPACPHCKTLLRWQVWPRPAPQEVLCWKASSFCAALIFLLATFHQRELTAHWSEVLVAITKLGSQMLWILMMTLTTTSPVRPNWRAGRWLVANAAEPEQEPPHRWTDWLGVVLLLGIGWLVWKITLPAPTLATAIIILAGMALLTSMSAAFLAVRVQRKAKPASPQ